MHTLNPFVCGTFHNEYYDDEPCLAASPRKYYKRKDSKKNPYSNRGLDKFSELLADLDEKRQRIYSQMNPHDISFVRFVYSNSDDNNIVPVVVKVKNSKSQEINNKVVRARTITLTHTSESTDKSGEERKQHKMETHHAKVAQKKKNFSWDMGKPSFYLPLVMILILLLLVVFGRSVSTLCICILWYVISSLKNTSSVLDTTVVSMKKKGLSSEKMVITKKKKNYVRGWSEKKMVVSEGITKKKDYVRRWSEKKMATDHGLLLSPTSGDR